MYRCRTRPLPNQALQRTISSLASLGQLFAAERQIVRPTSDLLMNAGIEIVVEFFDTDVAGLSVSASNGRFAGSATVLTAPGFAKQLSGAIGGFPTGPRDERLVELGTFDPNFAGGGVRLRLRCIDSAGHAVVEVQVRSDPQLRPEAASFSISVEAMAIDDWVVRLEQMPLAVGAKVSLVAA